MKAIMLTSYPYNFDLMWLAMNEKWVLLQCFTNLSSYKLKWVETPLIIDCAILLNPTESMISEVVKLNKVKHFLIR